MREPNQSRASHDALDGAVVTVASPVPAAGAGGAHLVTEAREAEDPEEIDVSDQVETLDDADATSDLDASEYLIIEDGGDEEDEVTSTSLAAGGAGPSSGEAASVRVAAPAEPPPDTKPGARSLPVEGDAIPAAVAPTPERMKVPSAVTAPKQTLVAAGTELKGRLASTYPVVINGVMDGEIDAPTLNVSSTGVILGTIKARTLRSEGTLSARVDAGEVFVSGTVRSQTVIRTQRLEVKLGASDQGRLKLTFGNCDFGSSDLRPAPEGEG